jgi:hypothetical protein
VSGDGGRGVEGVGGRGTGPWRSPGDGGWRTRRGVEVGGRGRGDRSARGTNPIGAGGIGECSLEGRRSVGGQPAAGGGVPPRRGPGVWFKVWAAIGICPLAATDTAHSWPSRHAACWHPGGHDNLASAGLDRVTTHRGRARRLRRSVPGRVLSDERVAVDATPSRRSVASDRLGRRGRCRRRTALQRCSRKLARHCRGLSGTDITE